MLKHSKEGPKSRERSRSPPRYDFTNDQKPPKVHSLDVIVQMAAPWSDSFSFTSPVESTIH